MTDLPLQAAAAHLLLLRLQTARLSQDDVQLEVDHVGHLDENQKAVLDSCRFLLGLSFPPRGRGGADKGPNLRLGGADRQQLEGLPALVVGVEGLHGVAGRLLHVGLVRTDLRPGAQQRDLP